MKDNKGFTLVEVVAAIAILSALSVSIMSIMVGSTNAANKEMATGSAELVLIDTKDWMADEIASASLGVKFWDKSPSYKLLAMYSYNETPNKATKKYVKYDCKTKDLYTFEQVSGYSATRGVTETLSDINSAANGKWKKYIGDWITYVDKVTEFDVVINEEARMTNLLLAIEYDDKEYKSQRSIFTPSGTSYKDIVQISESHS